MLVGPYPYSLRRLRLVLELKEVYPLFVDSRLIFPLLMHLLIAGIDT